MERPPALVRDIEPEAREGSFPRGFAQLGNFLYFDAETEANGHEVWRTDGTTTTLVSDINPAPGLGSVA